MARSGAQPDQGAARSGRGFDGLQRAQRAADVGEAGAVLRVCRHAALGQVLVADRRVRVKLQRAVHDRHCMNDLHTSLTLRKCTEAAVDTLQ